CRSAQGALAGVTDQDHRDPSAGRNLTASSHRPPKAPGAESCWEPSRVSIRPGPFDEAYERRPVLPDRRSRRRATPPGVTASTYARKRSWTTKPAAGRRRSAAGSWTPLRGAHTIAYG